MEIVVMAATSFAEDNHLTQVAVVLGTSQTMYARYERGANEMPIRHLVTLCKFYNVSADYLLNTVPDPKHRQRKPIEGQKHQD